MGEGLGHPENGTELFPFARRAMPIERASECGVEGDFENAMALGVMLTQRTQARGSGWSGA